MDWKDVAKKVASVAPLIGKLLPIPGAGIAGELIASAIGVAADPSSVMAAISQPGALDKIALVEAQNRPQLQGQLLAAETARIQSVNATMQAEAVSEHWPQWSWRPYWGFISGTAFLFVAILVCLLAYQSVLGGKPEAMAMVPQMIGSFAALFSIPGAILGVSAWHRGKQKRESAYREGGV